MIWNVYLDCACRNSEPPIFGGSTFKAWRVDYSRHSFTTWFSSLPEYRSDWILKLTSLFSSINGTFLNWTESQRLPTIVVLCYGSHQLNSLKVFSLRSRTLKRIYSGLFSSLLRLIPRIFLSQQTALISRDLLVYLLTSLIELLISSQPESTQWLKTKLKQELDYNAKRH